MHEQTEQSAFTLVEIMVVVSIIGTLSTMGAVAYGSVRAKARDAKYVSDAVTVQKAVDLFYADYGYYPYNPSDPYNRNWWYANRQPGNPGSLREAVSEEYLPRIPDEITSRPSDNRLLYYWTDYSTPGYPPTKYMVTFMPETDQFMKKGTCTPSWAPDEFCIGTGQ